MKNKNKKVYYTKKRKMKVLKFNIITLVITILLSVSAMQFVAQLLNIELIEMSEVNVIAHEPKVFIQKIQSETIREVTAYNVGDVNQTDSSPCIGAYSKVNLCEEVARGKNVCAANFVPLGTELLLEGNDGWSFKCIVWDRLNSRYPNRVDIAMNLWEYDRAVGFGLQRLNVKILGESEQLSVK